MKIFTFRGALVPVALVALLLGAQASVGEDKPARKETQKKRGSVAMFSGSGTSTCSRKTTIRPDPQEKLKQITVKNNGACTIKLTITCSAGDSPAEVSINTSESGTAGPCTAANATVSEFSIDCTTSRPGACRFSYN